MKLQAGDAENTRAWGVLCEASRRGFQEIYTLLGVDLEERGESFYKPYLPDIVTDLEVGGGEGGGRRRERCTHGRAWP